MGVLVCYDDYTYDVINAYHLDYLIDKGCVIGYDDTTEWQKNEDAEHDVILLTEVAGEIATPNRR